MGRQLNIIIYIYVLLQKFYKYHKPENEKIIANNLTIWLVYAVSDITGRMNHIKC